MTDLGSAYPPVALRRRSPNSKWASQPRTVWLEPDVASSFGSSLVTRFISSSLTLTLSASLAPRPPCCWESPDRAPRGTGPPERPGATLSEELHTPSLPMTHVFLGYCWSYSRFTTLPTQQVRPNNDKPSFRSHHVANSPPQGRGNCKQHSALSAEVKPLTGRNLAVTRLLQYVPDQTAPSPFHQGNGRSHPYFYKGAAHKGAACGGHGTRNRSSR
jgi:hypothetical protein